MGDRVGEETRGAKFGSDLSTAGSGGLKLQCIASATFLVQPDSTPLTTANTVVGLTINRSNSI